MNPTRSGELLVDADGLILGRMASFVAKRALEGSRVVVINAEKTVISGKKHSLLREAHGRLTTRTLGSLTKSPVHPRQPDRMVRRAIRGMLPLEKARGKGAFHRIRVYIGVPAEYKDQEATMVTTADSSKLTCKRVLVGELSEEIGGKVPR